MSTAALWVSEDGTTRVYGRRLRWFLIALTLFVTPVLAVGPTSEFFTDPRTIALLGWGIAGLGCVAAYRIYRMAIVAAPGVVTIRRFWTSRSVSAADILRFEPPPPYGTLLRSGMRVVLNDGRVLSATAFTRGQVDGDSVGVAESAELNDWLRGQAHSSAAIRFPR